MGTLAVQVHRAGGLDRAGVDSCCPMGCKGRGGKMRAVLLPVQPMSAIGLVWVGGPSVAVGQRNP
jgi:hypothetical protein